MSAALRINLECLRQCVYVWLSVNVSAVNGLSSTGCRQRAVVNELSSTAVVNTRRFHHRYRLNSGRLILKSCSKYTRDSEVVKRGVYVNQL